jgi:hypothetical protein
MILYSLQDEIRLKMEFVEYDLSYNVWVLWGHFGGSRFGLCVLADLFSYLIIVSLSYKYIL